MPGAQGYGAYDQFAWFYSQGWAEDYHKQARAVFEGHVFPRLPPGARVLDLCCGTGDLALALQARGYRVTGIDGSPEMLRYGRERVPEAEFLLEDARTFRLEAAFDAVVSTFDSLNHILELAELENVFRNVHRALVPGGLFVFDMNMEECFETLWRGADATVGDRSVSITQGSYDRSRKLGRADVTLFGLEDGVWRRSDVSVFERCYPREEIEAALAGAGFAGLTVRDAHEVGMRTDIALGRAFFFAVK